METRRSDSKALVSCSHSPTISKEEDEAAIKSQNSKSSTESLNKEDTNFPAVSSRGGQQQRNGKKQTYKSRSTKIDSFQKEVQKWEDFYDDMKMYLKDGSLNPRNQIMRQASAFFLNTDDRLYFTKTLRDGPATLLVVRSYEERMQVCRNIHLSTGEDYIHHRRDTMLDLLGQQYYWKGQRRDVCQCIATCEMCSVGLGGKRRAKPPGQKRDIRPVNKMPRIDKSNNPLLLTDPAINSGTARASMTSTTYTPPPFSSSSSSSSTSSSFSPLSTNPTETTVGGELSSCEHGAATVSTESNNINSLIRTTSSSLQPHTQTGRVSLIIPPTQTGSFSHVLSSSDSTEAPPTERYSTRKVLVKSDSLQQQHCANTDSGRRRRGLSMVAAPTTSALTTVDPLANLYTIAEACFLNNVTTAASSSTTTSSSSSSSIAQPSRTNPELSVAKEVTVSDNSTLQIFTTINEPYYETQTRGHVMSCDHPKKVPSTLSMSDSVAAVAEDYVMQASSGQGEAMAVEEEQEEEEEKEVEPSIYQLLFQLPSAPNASLCTAVIESMQLALMKTADASQLARAASQALTSVFDLSSTFSTSSSTTSSSSPTSSSTSSSLALILPSRAAAYLASLSSILTNQGLSNPQIDHPNPTPPIVIHDAACSSTGSPKAFSALLDVSNWNLGTPTKPMDRQTLEATVESNRVSAIVVRPYAYPPNTPPSLCLRDIGSVCRPRNVSVILDYSVAHGHSLPQLRTTIKELVRDGADMIILPNTEYYQGPPHTCVLIGKTNLLAGWWERLSYLQTNLPLPLLCSPYDTVGVVVAFKSLEVSTEVKSEPIN